MNTLKYITEKYGLRKIGKSPVELTKIGRGELAKVFAKLGFNTGATVGTWNGAYAQTLCAANSELKLFGIDLDGKTGRKDVPNNCKLVRMTSIDASKRFVDSSLDFVYIDGDTDLAGATANIQEWSKKVRAGGIIAGHDWIKYRSNAKSHTYEAVTAFTAAYRVAPWFVIGRQVDPVRSWFWVKA